MKRRTNEIPKSIRDDSVFFLINFAARLTNKAARIRLGSIGAWPGQIPIILYLLGDEGLSQKDLIERTRIEQSTMAEHLDRMERDGLIFRVRDAEDRRVYRIYLEDTIKRSANKLLDELEDGVELYTAGISKNDIDHFRTTIRKIIENLEEYTRG